MREQLELLVALQELDTHIVGLEDERNKIPEAINNLEEKVVVKEKRLEDVMSQLATLEDEKNEKKRAVELEKIRLKNTRNKESTIQNIKQYEAFVKEVETTEKSGEELESELKQINHRVSELSEEKKKLEGEIEKARAEIRGRRRELEDELKIRDEELDKLYDERDDLAEKIPEGLYLKYERIAEKKDDIAVAFVEHGHCSACNMAIPPQMYNELMRGDQLMACPACQRILFYRPPREDAASKAE